MKSMKREADIQADNIKNLMRLVAENPTLPIVPMVDSEIVEDDGHNSWMGKWGNAEIDYVLAIGERIYFKSLDDEGLIDGYIDKQYGDVSCTPDGNDLTSEALDKIGDDFLNSLPWEKVIVVWIQPL